MRSGASMGTGASGVPGGAVRARAGRSATPVIAELGTDGPAATDPWVLLGILD